MAWRQQPLALAAHQSSMGVGGAESVAGGAGGEMKDSLAQWRQTANRGALKDDNGGQRHGGGSAAKMWRQRSAAEN